MFMLSDWLRLIPAGYGWLRPIRAQAAQAVVVPSGLCGALPRVAEGRVVRP